MENPTASPDIVGVQIGARLVAVHLSLPQITRYGKRRVMQRRILYLEPDGTISHIDYDDAQPVLLARWFPMSAQARHRRRN
ncbi:MAG: hypothetical protein ABW022_26525 [Actinoplanes sp.]